MFAKTSIPLSQHTDLQKIVALHLREHFRKLGKAGQLNVKEADDFVLISSANEQFKVNYLVGLGQFETPDSCYSFVKNYAKTEFRPLIWFNGYKNKILEDRLIHCGFTDVGPLTGLAFDLTQYAPMTTALPELEILPVKTDEHFTQWCSVHESVWKRDPSTNRYFFNGFLPSANRFEDAYLFLAVKQGRVVGASMLDVQGTIGGFYWDAVLESERNQGIGQAMVCERLRIAKEKGCQVIVAQCLDASLPVYLKTGFQKISDMAVFRYNPS